MTDPQHWTQSREWLYTLLQQGVITVTFTKKDGTTRVMRCTLKPSLLPEADRNKSSDRKKSETSMPVYDVEAGGWRSFVVSSIKSVVIKLDELA